MFRALIVIASIVAVALAGEQIARQVSRKKVRAILKEMER